MKICVGASAGGHMNQLLRLLKLSSEWRVAPSVCITTKPELVEKLKAWGNAYNVGECNRHHPIQAFRILLKGLKLMKSENPDIILTTGSMPLAMVCVAGKIMRKKVVWIDSIANSNRLSVSGRLVYRFADLFLVQWENLVEKYPKAEYCGSIL